MGKILSDLPQIICGLWSFAQVSVGILGWNIQLDVCRKSFLHILISSLLNLSSQWREKLKQLMNIVKITWVLWQLIWIRDSLPEYVRKYYLDIMGNYLNIVAKHINTGGKLPQYCRKLPAYCGKNLNTVGNLWKLHEYCGKSPEQCGKPPKFWW